MSLNRSDPVHVALIELAFAASQLVDDLHDYQHYIGGQDDGIFSLQVLEDHYTAIGVAWARFQEAMRGGASAELPPTRSEEFGQDGRIV
jgi:hypothetical protein